jgi:hypothetical protein
LLDCIYIKKMVVQFEKTYLRLGTSLFWGVRQLMLELFTVTSG